MNCNATAISPVTSKRKISPSFGEWRYRKVERSQAEAGASSSRAAQLFDRGSFVTMLCRCMEGCGVAPSSYSGRSFRRGAATRTAANGADADTTRALGRWCSDCFRCYVDKSAAERAAISRTALYSNTSSDLRLEIPARHSSLACSLTRLPL
ncbi:uncharacterized protein UDID_19634 [Ustilago sp. UG-2017a]|nr:uncharacterized protein UDID_19634 [Ustilago sp. UG-2017a]